MLKALSIAALLAVQLPASAYSLRIDGNVTFYHTGEVMDHALVRVYKNGTKVETFECNTFGKYNLRLDNDADYVLRFSAPGFVTKCFGVDTHGLVWEGEESVKTLKVEMTMIERVPGMDLDFFDMPVGRLKFEPATGLVTWEKEYSEWIAPRTQSVMSEYDRRWAETAEANKPKATDTVPRR